MVVSLLLAAIAATQSTPLPANGPKVTFATKAARIERVFEQLSEVVGIKLKAGEGVIGEVVFVSVKDVQLGELMKRIAESTEGEWKRDRSDYVLFRRPATFEKAKERGIRDRAQKIKSAIKKFVESVDPNSLYDEKTAAALIAARKLAFQRSQESNTVDNFRAMIKLDDRLPYGRAIARIVSEIDPTQLARTEPGSKIVYAASPTSRQFRTGPNSKRLTELLFAEQNTIAEAANSQPGGFGKSGQLTFGAAKWHSDPMSGIPNRFILVINRSSVALSDGLVFHLLTEGGDGRINYSGDVYLEQYGDLSSVVNVQPLKPIKDSAVEPSPLATEFYRTRVEASTLGTTELPTVSMQLKGWLTDPLNHDPLAMFPSDILEILAKAQAQNIVAVLPDMSFLLSNFKLSKKNPMLSTCLAALAQSGCKLESSNGWVIGTYENLWDATNSRAPRKTVEAYINSVMELGYASLSAKQLLASDMPSYAAQTIPSEYAIPFTYYFGSDDDSSFRVSKFLGTLSETQRSQLFNRGSLDLSAILPLQTAAFDNLVYSQRLAIVKDFDNGGQSFDIGTLDSEPSQGLGRGIKQCSISSTKHELDLLYCASRETPGRYLAPRRYVDVGRQLAAREVEGGSSQSVSFDRFIPGKQVQYRLSFTFGGDLTLTVTLTDHLFDARSQKLELDKLPNEIKAAVMKAAEEERARRQTIPPRL